MLKLLSLIDESQGIWFEHVLYKSVQKYVELGGRFYYLPIYPNQIAQSGSTGQYLFPPKLKTYIKSFVKAILYKFNVMVLPNLNNEN